MTRIQKLIFLILAVCLLTGCEQKTKMALETNESFENTHHAPFSQTVYYIICIFRYFFIAS